jgi:hypothetical protein
MITFVYDQNNYKQDNKELINRLFSLFVCFEPQEQFFSYLAAVTFTSDRAANLDIHLAL